MIKAFLFDYGGVITKGGGKVGTTSNLTDKLAKNLHITSQQAHDLVGQDNWNAFMTGVMPEDTFWLNLEKRFGKPIKLEWRDVWNTWEEMQPEPAMVELVNTLRQDYPVGLLSTTVPPTAQTIREHGGYDMFDFVLLSCETGSAKPEKAAYELALSKLPGIKPNEVVFIDDQERFLLPAQQLGLKIILADTPEQIKVDIDQLLS